VGVFAYSQEEGTKSGQMEQLPEEVRLARRDRAMAVQQEIARRRNQLQVGRALEVLAEGRSPRGRGWFVGRCYRQSPGIDGVVVFRAPAGAQLRPGDMVQVRITGVKDYDLLGETTEPLTVDGIALEEDLSLPVFTPTRHQ